MYLNGSILCFFFFFSFFPGGSIKHPQEQKKRQKTNVQLWRSDGLFHCNLFVVIFFCLLLVLILQNFAVVFILLVLGLFSVVCTFFGQTACQFVNVKWRSMVKRGLINQMTHIVFTPEWLAGWLAGWYNNAASLLPTNQPTNQPTDYGKSTSWMTGWLQPPNFTNDKRIFVNTENEITHIHTNKMHKTLN